MKFTYSWLKRYLDTTASPQEIAQHLVDLGLEVEGIHDPQEILGAFKVVEILETTPHPDADRLKICRVNTGESVLQIVCGAPNARAGMKSVLALPGSIVPAIGQPLKVGKIRGVESFGMMCSSRELGLGEEDEGIFDLENTILVGTLLIDALGINDPVFDVSVTPNRGDCLGVINIARDLAAKGVGRFISPSSPSFQGSFPSPIQVNIQDKEGCPYYVGRYIKGVTNRPSPDWLQKALIAIGQTPISALVDITNYLSFDRARPLHVFDADKIKGSICIRQAQEAEAFKGLNDKEYFLTSAHLAIVDDQGPVALGGVIGGLESSCTLETQNVFLEAAWFDPIRIASVGRSLSILSDARSRFERGVDPASTIPGIEEATRLIQEICGGEASELAIAGAIPNNQHEITLPYDLLQQRGGVEIAPEQAIGILKALGLQYLTERSTPAKGVFRTPTWRFDLSIPEDLVEEILRVYGYDQIPTAELPHADYGLSPAHGLSPKQLKVREIKSLLAGRGLQETITWSFLGEEQANDFSLDSTRLTLDNPISQDLACMRPSLLPNLLQACGRNHNRGIETANFFEVGPQFLPKETLVCAGIRTGFKEFKTWQNDIKELSAFDVKADVFALLENWGLNPDSVQLSQGDAPAWYHPGRSGSLKLGHKVLGYFGEIHPSTLHTMDIKTKAVCFEIFIENLPEPKSSRPSLALSPYQPVERDYAFVVPEQVAATAVLKAAKKAEPNLITSIVLFDVFKGPSLGENMKSLGIKVRLEPKDKTFTEEELTSISNKIIQNVQSATGGVLRQ